MATHDMMDTAKLAVIEGAAPTRTPLPHTTIAPPSTGGAVYLASFGAAMGLPAAAFFTPVYASCQVMTDDHT